MADIFISYSRRNLDEAKTLVKRLQDEGIGVWLDQNAIEGAEQWATEIVEGINSCTTFILLISGASIESANVLKELSLASEKGKRILPVDIEAVVLPSSFEYQLAGIQRVPIADHDAILRAHRRGVERKTTADLRKSLIILPFEDLSPEKDNQWFADGLAGELISSLSTLRSLRVLDRKSSLELRSLKQSAREIARHYDTRYIVEGTVMKLGQKIKISAALIDTQTLDHLWQDSFKGVMDDIFELQESVTEQIVSGLKVHLTTDEKKKLNDRGTENAEAYELYLKGLDYFRKGTKEGFETALVLHKEAVRVDPNFAMVYCELANCCSVLYRKYIRDEQLLVDAEGYIRRAEELGAHASDVYRMKSQLAVRRKNYDEAIAFGKLSIEADPEFALAYFAIGMAYSAAESREEAAEAFAKYAQLRQTDIAGRLNYLIAIHSLGNKEKLKAAAIDAVPIYQRHIRFTPDDLEARGTYALILEWSGETVRALEEAERLAHEEKLGASSMFNLAHIFEVNGYMERMVEILRLSVERGFREIEAFKHFEQRNIPGIKEVTDLVKQKIEQEKNG